MPSSPAGSPPTPERTLTLSEILRHLSGAWLLMVGRSEGLKRLDLTADGFWTSFAAILVALPPVALSWLEFEESARPDRPAAAGPAFVYAAHALADLTAWLLPVIVILFVAERVGASRKIVPLVVATNWGGALIAWIMAPCWLFAMLVGSPQAVSLFGLVTSVASIALTVRLVSTAIGRDAVGAVAIVVLMILSSLVSYAAVADVTGLPLV